MDMTLSVLADFGIRVENEAYRIIPGGQKYRTRYRVEEIFPRRPFSCVPTPWAPPCRWRI